MCNTWCLEFTKKILPHFKGMSILEVGSRDVNGSVKPLFDEVPNLEYLGVDLVPGDKVDQVVDVCKLDTCFSPASFDAVLTTEMLEHCHDWKLGLIQMVNVLKPGGLLLITTRSPGFELHGYPYDFWRFTQADLRSVLEPIADILEMDDDLTLGWPCGVGVIARLKAVDEKGFEQWRQKLAATDVTAMGEIKIEELIDILEAREKDIIRLQKLVDEQTQWALATQKTAEEQAIEIRRLQGLVEEQTAWAEQSHQTVLERDQEILHLNDLLKKTTAHA